MISPRGFCLVAHQFHAGIRDQNYLQIKISIFAVGDGNHSLATAKTMYEEIKQKLGKDAENHPARYALVEIVNVHDEALEFEPIYRVMFSVDPEKVLSDFENYAKNLNGNEKPQTVECIIGKKVKYFDFNNLKGKSIDHLFKNIDALMEEAINSVETVLVKP